MNHFIRIVIPFTVHKNVVEDVVEEHAHNQKDISESGENRIHEMS